MQNISKGFLISLVMIFLLAGCTARKLPEEQIIVVGQKTEESVQEPAITNEPVSTEEPGITVTPESEQILESVSATEPERTPEPTVAVTGAVRRL